VDVSAPAQLDERWRLVAPHRDRLIRLLRSRCATTVDAEDCVHEAMLRVATFPNLDNARAAQMLTVVALRIAVDQHRQPQRRRAALRRLFASTVTRSPEDVALDRLQAQNMLEHAESLAGNERSVLLLRAQGAGAADVASELGLTYKSAESAYTRARRKLRAVAAATAALAGLGLRHALRGTSSTSAMAATAVALVALAGSGDRAPVRAAGPGASAHDEHVQRLSNAGAVSASSPGSAAPRTEANSTGHGPAALRVTAARSQASSPPSGAAQQVLAVDVKATGTDAPASVTRHHDGRSFTQAVADCVAQGVSVDPHRLGCP